MLLSFLSLAAAAPVTNWLQLGPTPVPPPAFDADPAGPLRLAVPPTTRQPPAAGVAVGTFGAEWQTVATQGDGIRWLVTWVSVASFAEGKLAVTSEDLSAVWLDDEKLGTGKGGAEPTTHDVVMEPGTHLLRVGLVSPATIDLDLGAVQFTSSQSPSRTSSLRDVLDATVAQWVQPSPDGRYVAVGLKSPAADTAQARTWVDVFEASSGVRTRTVRGESGFSWAPDASGWASFTKAGDEDHLWFTPLAGPSILLTTQEHLESARWLPDGSGLVVTQGRPAKEDKRDAKRLQGTPDRWDDFRDPARLLWVARDGSWRVLTGGDAEVSLYDIAPDGKTMIVGTVAHDTAVRPYSRTTVESLDLFSLVRTPLFSAGFLDDIRVLADGRLLIRGGASLFDAVGQSVPGLPNDYDGEVFLWDQGAVTPITRDFAPSVTGMENMGSGAVLLAEDRDRIRLYALTGKRLSPTAIDVGIDSVMAMGTATRTDMVAWVASSSNAPPRVGLTVKGKSHVFWQPDAELLAPVRFGRLESYDVPLPNGDVLTGRIHYPADFDPRKSWPTIVYYYGGTNPVSRLFGGRYPHDVWTAHGYVVYVPQPSGATGFGPEWAQRHVGDWGATSADEVIAGTKAFLADHAWADPKKVGCIGASYGGFLTMTLLTRTDLFGAAVSHAGISNLASYWGEGWWGHTYSAVASGEQLPWKNPELYVGHSPLYKADKIATPLLLTHGVDDTNVPVGESDSMYTALKVLGRDVEMLRFDDENHWILERDRRYLWSRSILAWFDSRLKGETAWWDYLWKEEEEKEE